jgi:hypothetical protein
MFSQKKYLIFKPILIKLIQFRKEIYMEKQMKYILILMLLFSSLYSQNKSGEFSGLGSLPFLTDAKTKSISPENPTGEKGKGGMAIPNPKDPKPFVNARAADDLGQGWKVSPFIRINKGETAILMDVEGEGIIQHIWMVEGLSRSHVLRFYWDNEKTPSIEVPAPDFFAVGHELFAPVNSLAVVVNAKNALNCYWPMPFKKHVKITLTNEDDKDLELMAYQITYSETTIPDNSGYFHAQWRRSMTNPDNPDYVIIDGVKGKGRYVGTFLAWTQLSSAWFGEGEIKFYLDGDKKFPTICGTGTEDYFCGSWGFPEIYTTAYSGNTLKYAGVNGPPKWSLYRWHIQDPICFQKDLKVTIQALGWYPNKKYKPLDDDIASVAYWYQTEPHEKFPVFPELKKRWPR